VDLDNFDNAANTLNVDNGVNEGEEAKDSSAFENLEQGF
jgi:hypothetical protein|tara:strand:+ start:398 stop:514 length:117 start_codon:yes stop_codon:yes gene_type:complete